MAETKLAPLSTQVPIVDAQGNPTPYFQQLMQIFIDEKNAVADGVIENVEDLDDLAAVVAALELDDLADVVSAGAAHGSVLYKDSSDWQVLGPGTAGDVLTTNGASADPTWETPSVSGGGSWTELLHYDFASAAAVATKECDVTGYKEILCIGLNMLSSSNVQRCIQVSTNGGSSWYTTSGDYADTTAAGATSNNAAFFGHNTAITNARNFAIQILNNGFNRSEPTALCLTRNVVQIFRGNGGGGGFVTTPFNRVRVMGSAGGTGTPAGTFSSGTFQVLGR